MQRPALLLGILGVLAASAGAQVLTITTSSLPAGETGTPYSYLLSAAGGTPPYSWSATRLPPNFTISNSGILSGAPAATAAGTYSVLVTVTDQASHSANATFNLLINPGFQIVTTTLPNGSVGVNYSQVIQAVGGTPPYSFSFTPSTIFSQNAPPPGLTLATTGTLTGVPTKAGTYTFGVTATDSTKDIATSTYTLNIGTPLAFTTASPLPPGVAGSNYSQIIFASGGTPPYTFSIVGSTPPGLELSPSGTLSGIPTAIGANNFVVKVTDSRQVTATKQYQVVFSAGPPLLQTSAAALDFTALIGGDAPPSQSIAIVSTNQNPVNYSVLVDGGAANLPAPAWLTVTPTHGVTPGRLTVSVNQGGLQSAALSATIHVIVPGSNSQTPIDIAVTLEVSGGAPQLEAVPAILTFAARSQAPSKLSQPLALRNSGGSGTLPFTASVTGQSSWITSVAPASGRTVLNSPTLLQVQVDTTGLPVGHYRDVIHVTWFGGAVDVPVVLFVSDQGPILDLGIKGIRFPAREGSGSTAVRRVNVINRGDPGSTIHWTASLLSGQEWLALTVPAGIATVNTPGSLPLQPGPNAAGLPSGARYALVRVSDPLALNSPQYLAAVFDNGPASDPARPDSDSSGFVFTAPVGSTQAVSAQFTIETSSTPQVSLQASASTTDGANWLSVIPAAGSASTSLPGILTVTANPSNLIGGVYTGEVDFAIGSQIRTLAVTLIVTNVNVAVCASTRLIVTPIGLTTHFSVPAGWTQTLRVQVNDDCGRAFQNASVVASFSSGDSPVPLTSDGGNGTYSASWAPGIAMSQVNVIIRAVTATVQPASTQLIGDVFQNSAPTLAKSGTLHNLNPLIGGGLSPGVVAQVFGSGLATSTGTAGVVPLPVISSGTQLLTGALAAPLYYTSPSQLTVQIPVELAPNRQYSIIASVNGALTLPDTIDVVPVAPGIAAFPDGSLIAQHADFTLVDPTHPAKRGEILTIYLVGLGATNPPVASGNPPPASEPFARPLVAPSLSIDSQPAQINFAGLTPFSVGLFQINFQVPANARLGTPLNVVVNQGGVPSNLTTLVVAP